MCIELRIVPGRVILLSDINIIYKDNLGWNNARRGTV